jgi:hypothetical protein
MNPEKAIRTMNLVRIVAVVLIIVSAVLYFTAKEYAIYPALAGFAVIALINLPLNIWLAFQREKQRKLEMEQYEAGRKKDEKDKAKPSDDPIRYENRKSGLKWGGGNVHAANADRKPRKKFLR